MVRVRKSSEEQQKYFGNFAWRPYLNIYIEQESIAPNEDLVREAIKCSFVNEPLETGAHYEKYFDLDEGEAMEFAYARILKYPNSDKHHYEKFIPIEV